MKIRLWVTAIFSVGLMFLPTHLSGKAQCSTRSAKEEGKLSNVFSQLDSSDHLFAIDGEYVLHAVYADGKNLSEAQVVPKFFFHSTHPEWTEPNSSAVLSPDTYDHLLNQIQSVKPLGNLIRRGDRGLTLNLRTTFLDQYENGMVQRTMFRDSPEKPYEVGWFRVAYFRPIAGKLQSMEAPSTQVADQAYRIKVNNNWYWTTQKQFERLRQSQTVSLEAAGPISEKF